MSYGKMNNFITIFLKEEVTDDEGFPKAERQVIANVRGYKEGRHGSLRWANMSTFSEATDLFRIRAIPNIEITPDFFLKCDGVEYKILSTEDVKGRGMYIEIMAKRMEGVSNGKG